MATSSHLRRRERREEARHLHVEQVARSRHTGALPVRARRNGDDDLFAALSAEGTETRAFHVDERGIDRRTRREECLGALQDVIAAQVRRALLNGSCWCGHVILKGRSKRKVEPTPGSDSSEMSP